MNEEFVHFLWPFIPEGLPSIFFFPRGLNGGVGQAQGRAGEGQPRPMLAPWAQAPSEAGHGRWGLLVHSGPQAAIISQLKICNQGKAGELGCDLRLPGSERQPL